MTDRLSRVESFLAELPPLNWDDIESVAPIADEVMAKLANDKALLGELVERARSTPTLFDMCECHDLDDKIVLHNDLKRGYRIRLRLANDDQYERAHNHRFSFAARVLYGTYFQQWYHIDGTPGEQTVPSNVVTLCRRVEPAGASFTIDGAAFHSTQTSPKTVSLMICGRAERDKTFIINMKSGKVWGKKGRKDETSEEIAACKMPEARFDEWVAFMREVDVIA
jgi:hypothetical protein